MSIWLQAYQLVLAVSMLVSSGIAIYSYANKDKPGGLALTGMMAGGWFWAFSLLLSVIYRGTPTSLFWTNAALLGVVTGVFSMLVFALQYTGRGTYTSWPYLGLLCIEPIVLHAVVWTTDLRTYYWTVAGKDPGHMSGYALEPNLVTNVHVVYSYLVMGVAGILLLQMAFRSSRLYRRQTVAILVGIAAPWAGSVLFIYGPSKYDFGPIFLTLSGLAFSWAIYRAKFLEVMPLARNTVVDNIGAGVFVLDRSERVLDINDVGREMFDLDGEDVIGNHVSTFLSSFPTVYDQYQEVADVTEDFEFRSKVGSRYYNVQISPVDNDSGALLGRVFLVTDVTDEIQRQQELQTQNDRLDRFTSVVSHDLRNPLAVARGGVELFEETGKREHIEKIERAHERMDELIDDLLTLARQDNEIDDVDDLSLDGVSTSAWEMVDTDGMSLVLDSDRTVTANEQRFTQLLENLFRNASEHGGDTVRIGATEDGFYVADDGPGFPGPDATKIFEDGFTTKKAGTGLGMTIISMIADAHGWELDADESESGGARIDVTVTAGESAQLDADQVLLESQ